MQFDEIGFNHVSKVVDDITDKIIKYYIQKEYKRDLRNIGIVDALVLSEYSQDMPDERVQYGEKSYSLRDLYENIGIAEGREGSFIYYRRGNEDSKYGYRRSFIGEKSKRMYDTGYTRVEITNVELENYVYAVDSQNFKDIVKQVFYIVDKEIQVPSAKRIKGCIVKIKSHVEREVNFLSKHILCCYQQRKESLGMHVKYLVKETGEIGRFSREQYIRESKELLGRVGKNKDVISLMQNNLKKIPNSLYYQKVKEAFISRAEVISQDYRNLFELQFADTIKSSGLWSHIKPSSVKGISSLFGKMNFRDVCPSVEEFTGMRKQIEEIYEKLQEGTVAIVGPSGVGKTQLARKFIEENKEVYLHAYEVNTQDMLSIENAFASFTKDRLAMSMGDKDDGKERKKYLFLFEGAKKEDVEKVLRIRREKGGFDCLFTSSDHGYQDIAEVTLDTLEEEQAVQLIKQILKTVNKSQDEQIKILVGKLKNFPLAIKLAATYIKNSKLSASEEVFGICEYLEQYKEFDRVFPRNTGQSECDRVLQITSLISMKAVQKISYSKEVNKILNTMAYLGPSQIDPDLFLNCNMDENELYSVFELLEQYSIIHAEENDEYKVYIMHELVKKAIRSQLSMDEEKQVLSHAIKLVFGTEEDFYTRDVDHFLSLFYRSYRHESLAKESCDLACTIISTLNMLCQYKEALTFGLEALKILIATNKDTMIARYEIARTMIALGEYDLALKMLWDLKRQYILNDVFPLLSLDKEIIFIYFKQKRYENVFSYIRSDNFLLTKLLDEKDRCYLDNYLSIVNTVAKISVMQKRYTKALTILHYGRELRDEIFLKRNDFDSYSDPYLCPSNRYEFYNLEARYIYDLLSFFIVQDRKKVTIKEEMLPHKEDLPRELSIQALFNQLQDILKNQEGSQYLQPAPYLIEEDISEVLQKTLRKKTLQRFEEVLQLQKEYGFLESHPKVLSVKFYIALLHSYLEEREKTLQEFQQMQELQERVIGINHPDTLETVNAIQKLFARDKDRLTYLENEIEKREPFLNAKGVVILERLRIEKSNGWPSLVNGLSSEELLLENKRRFLDTENIQVKRKKTDNHQQVSSYLDSVDIDSSYQQHDMVSLYR